MLANTIIETLAEDTDKVHIRAHKSEPGKGLTYPAFDAIMLDDAFDSEGWDVVEVYDRSTGYIVSVYCFSIEK